MALAVLGMVVPAVALFPGAGELAEGLKADIGAIDLIIFAAGAVLSGVVKGALGFGESLVFTPIAAILIDPTVAVIVLAVPPLMVNVFQVGETGTGLGYVRRNWRLVLFALAGSAIGVFFLGSFESGPLIPLLIAILILAYVIFQVAKGFATFEKAGNPTILGGVGFAEGFLLGAANFGPLLPTYLHSFERNAERYIGGLSMVLALIFGERVIQMLVSGLMSPYLLWLGAVTALVTLVGLAAGTVLRRVGIDQRLFSRLVVGLLLLVSLSIFYTTVPQLL